MLADLCICQFNARLRGLCCLLCLPSDVYTLFAYHAGSGSAASSFNRRIWLWNSSETFNYAYTYLTYLSIHIYIYADTQIDMYMRIYI